MSVIGTVTRCLCNIKRSAHLISKFSDFILCFVAHDLPSSHNNITTQKRDYITVIIDARWWPEWYEYTIGTDNIPDFGQRVLFHPLRKPPLDKYRLWTDTIPLSDPNYYLSGPFHFEVRHDILNPCNYIARDQWLLLHSICSVSSVVPPILSSAATTAINLSTKFFAIPHSSLLSDKPHKKRKTTSTSSAPPLRRSSRHQL